MHRKSPDISILRVFLLNDNSDLQFFHGILIVVVELKSQCFPTLKHKNRVTFDQTAANQFFINAEEFLVIMIYSKLQN